LRSSGRPWGHVFVLHADAKLAFLEAVAGRDLLARSYEAALDAGYLWHEFGDSHLILP
jgi:S-adenosylmethionine:tRNA-ribosyltransferase-isomerase (queuine synthetase)